MDTKTEIFYEKTENLVAEGSRESIITPEPKPSEVVLRVSDLDSKPICRICYGGTSRERLLRPCKCKGTIEFVHRQCLERWLEEKNFEACELCHHHYETRRTQKSCWDWLKQPETRTERRNFVGDFTCFIFLTPLGIATFYLCAQGAIYYQKIKSSTLETIALISLAAFLVLAYLTWIVLCTRYHIVMWKRWRDQHWNVHIIDRTASEETSERPDTVVNIPSDIAQGPALLAWESQRLIESESSEESQRKVPSSNTSSE